jgi:hypothetical protein
VGYFYKAVKTILLYPSTNTLPGEFKLQLYDRLSKFLDEFGPLQLMVRGDQLIWEDETVHEESGYDDNIIATFTRDGIQSLTFAPGMEFDELESFLEILKRVIHDRAADEDLVTLLWEASLTHIRYTAIGELEAVDYASIEQRLLDRPTEIQSDTGPINYATIVLDEGEEAHDEVGGPPAAIVGDSPDGEPATKTLDAVDVTRIIDDLADLSDDLSQVDAYLREATQFDPVRSTIGILFEILIGEDEILGFRETSNILDNLYDRFVDQADFASAVRIYQGLLELERAEKDHSPARAKRLFESRLRTADKLRIGQLTAAINAHPGCDIEGCRLLVLALPVEMLPHLVAALGELEHYPARKMICDVLAERGADRIDVIGNGMFDKRWYVVRNVAIILGNIGGARACTYLEKAIQHADERVRREVIEALVRMDPANSSHLLHKALDDPRVDLRVLALQALAQRVDVRAGEIAAEHVASKSFRRLEPTEQKEWLVALARIQGDEALPLFRSLIEGWALVDRDNKLRLRALTTLSLGESDGPEIEVFLQRLEQNRNERVREAARRALNRIHQRHGETGPA